MDSNEVITALTPSLFFSSASTSSLAHPPSSDDESLPPPPVVRPCGACKGLRRRCVATCILAPYFPPTQPLKFLAVHKVFGASNIFKFLQGLPESQRADAVDSMVYEATTRIRDPVYGCAGVIFNQQKLIKDLQMELDIAKSQLFNITYPQENLPATMTCLEMKEAQLPMLQQPSLKDFIFGATSTPAFQTWENFSEDNSFLPFDVTDSRGM